MQALSRITERVKEILTSAIEEAGGNEVFAVGVCEEAGVVSDITIVARGNSKAVPIVKDYADRGDVLIHNHPSGGLTPSDADLNIAASYADVGIGFWIIDNDVDRIYAVTEPVKRPETIPLDLDRLEELLLPGGAMSKVFSDFELRSAQIDMMREVARGFNEGRIVVAEAGTGVGKSVAYLIPAFLWSHLNEERIVISTATINLQQQLIDNDVPLVREVVGLDVPVTLVKGRRNYLCPRRLEEAQEENVLFSEHDEIIGMIHEWSTVTQTGERSDLPGEVTEEIWSRVASEPDGCRGLRCAARGDCFIVAARRRAVASRILITNHHLLFSDLAIRQAGVGRDGTAVLPPFQHIIFDEAHNIEKNATSFFSERYDFAALERTLSILHRTKRGTTAGVLSRLSSFVPNEGQQEIERAIELVSEIDTTAAELNRISLGKIDDRTLRLKTGEGNAALGDAIVGVEELRILLLRIGESIQKLVRLVPDELREESSVIDAGVAARRLDRFGGVLDGVLHVADRPDLIFWLERRRNAKGEEFATYHTTPIDVSRTMRETIFDAYDTVICTSATLSVRGQFDYFVKRVGLSVSEGNLALHSFDSPFPYQERVLLAAINGPEPTEASYQSYIEKTLTEILSISEGSALVLFTSYRMLEATHAAVTPALNDLGIAVLRQGTRDRSKLLSEFADDTHSVLFATDSFWEGVDTPGEALRVVAICRLPFRVPNDPVLEARVEAIEAEGGNAFYDLSIPQAVMRLKQGFGRLMRRSSDRGVVAILDSRVLTRQYGRLFLESLPESMTAFGSKESIADRIESFLYTQE